jgi:hypothetical protein
MADFDYNAPAEIFGTRQKRHRQPTLYRRFPSGAEAVRFAVEHVPASLLIGLVFGMR